MGTDNKEVLHLPATRWDVTHRPHHNWRGERDMYPEDKELLEYVDTLDVHVDSAIEWLSGWLDRYDSPYARDVLALLNAIKVAHYVIGVIRGDE